MRAFAITGPTASGKTALSLSVAEAFCGEIISCDSMQIYREMNIGTAKPTAEERARAPHHLIDFLDPRDTYSAERYRKDALDAIKDVISRGNTPIIVGGTGLYIDTLMRVPSEKVPESSPEYREKLLSSVRSGADVEALWERLRSVDPESAEKIHKNNVKRVIRALEIFDATGTPKSELDKQTRAVASEVDVFMITLDFHNRDNLYSRVDRRVDIMMDEGLLDEVRSLYARGLLPEWCTASAAIGYKEFLSYIKGECSLDESIELLKLSSRRYAKRQLTWFRHESDAYRLYLDTDDGAVRRFDDVIEEALSVIGARIGK